MADTLEMSMQGNLTPTSMSKGPHKKTPKLAHLLAAPFQPTYTHGDHLFSAPAFAGGKCFSRSSLDTLFSEVGDRNHFSSPYLAPHYVLPPCCCRVPAQAIFTHDAVHLLKRFVEGILTRRICSVFIHDLLSMCQLPATADIKQVWPNYAHVTYSVVSNGMLMLGVYRTQRPKYVVTNPPLHMKVHNTDRVFVVCNSEHLGRSWSYQVSPVLEHPDH